MKRLLILAWAWACVTLACESSAAAAAVAVATATSTETLSAPATVTATGPVRVRVRVCGDVNVRAQPAARGSVLRWLDAGETVTVYETREGWVRVSLWTDVEEWITEDVICP